MSFYVVKFHYWCNKKEIRQGFVGSESYCALLICTTNCVCALSFEYNIYLANIKIFANIFTVDQNRNRLKHPQKSILSTMWRKKLSQQQRLSPLLPWSMRAEHTGALAFDHGNFNQSFSHFIGNSSPPSPFKHCLGELSAASSISGNYTCKVTLGAGLNISAKCMCC